MPMSIRALMLRWSVGPGRVAMPLGLLGVMVLCLLVGRSATRAAAPEALHASNDKISGVLQLTLDDALPFASKGDSRQLRDLQVDLILREGRVDSLAWVYLEMTPGVEHQARVVSSEVSADRIKLKLDVTIRHYPPKFAGGTAVYDLVLDRSGSQWLGEYAGEVKGLNHPDSLALWRSLGGRGMDPGWVGSVRSATTHSVTRVPRRTYGSGGTEVQPVLAHGQVYPLSDMPRGLAVTTHPRLIATGQTLDAIKALAATPEGQAILAAMRSPLESGHTGDFGPGLTGASDGFAAAGWATLFIFAQDKDALAKSAAAAIRAIEPLQGAAPILDTESGTAPPGKKKVGKVPALGDAQDGAGQDPLVELDAGGAGKDPASKDQGTAGKNAPNPTAIARQLAGLAVAYDLIGSQWPDDVRQRVAQHLAQQAWQLSAIEPASLKTAVIGPAGVLGDPAGPYDTRLALLRSSAGLAAMAVLGDSRDAGITDDQLQQTLTVSARSVRRFLQTGIGESGAGTGQHGLAETVEILFPFLQAWQRATGSDLSQGTGAGMVGVFALYTDGRSFDLPTDPACGFWLTMTRPQIPSTYQALASQTLKACHAPPANPWHGLYALVNAATAPALPPPPALPPAPAPPLAIQDRRTGSYVLRSDWNDPARDFVTLVQLGSGAPEAASLRGQISVHGLGRDWLARATVAPGRFDWPSTRRLNVIQILDSLSTARKEALPTQPGHLARVRIGRDGNGSVAMTAHGFEEHDQPIAGLESVEDVLEWRTVGVDYSKASGADAVVVMVGGTWGLGERQRVWEIDVGDVPASAVKIDGLSFSLQPPGSTASMTGTALFPPTAWLEYQPPQEGRGGRMRVFMVKPGPSVKEMLSDSMLEKSIKVDRLGSADQDDVPEEPLQIDISFLLNEKNPQREAQLQDEGKAVFNKLFKYTSSAKMGAPDRFPRARGNCVVVLTIQQGPAPKVQVLPLDAPGLFKVGPQTVDYSEYLVEFGTP